MCSLARSLRTVALGQGSANYSLWAKSRPLPVFANKMELDTDTLIPLHTVYGCFHTSAELSSCNRDDMAYKA